MGVAAIVYPIFILCALLLLIIPVVMGIYIYRDAKKRGMNAPLWTLLGVLAPGFIGLIIYLIVRGDHPDLQCPACSKPVSADFSVCPYCGAMLKEKCAQCGYTLECGWVVCASCGTEIPEDQRRAAVHSKGGNGLKWLLGLIIVVPLTLMVLLFAATCLYTAGNAGCSLEFHQITKSAIYESQTEILDWISDCDAKGDGTYALRTDYSMGAESVTNLLVYRNDGYSEVSTSYGGGGWFASPELLIDFYVPDYESDLDYTLVAFEFMANNDKDTTVSFSDYDQYMNQSALDCKMIETDALDGLITDIFDMDYAEKSYDDCMYSIEFDESMTAVYGIGTEICKDGTLDLGNASHAQSADGSDLAGDCFYFSHLADLTATEYTLVVTLFDENEAEIFRTEPVTLSGDTEAPLIYFFLDDDGNITYK
ncbi:MAG: zinc ribbon domain-containing protein [Ruminococcaceae bacterium]|nr:zinc ribbon domain-containing protein [Oscillospiraceae bacterium]